MGVVLALGLLLGLIAIALVIYFFTARRYQSANSVANAYDQCTQDGILEFYWGEHIHLGHYGSPPSQKLLGRQGRFRP